MCQQTSTSSIYGNKDYPYLEALIGGWFHEDYRIDGDMLEEIIPKYKNVHPSEHWKNTKTDILRFVQTRDDLEVKEDFVRLFRPGLDPEVWGMSTRQWLLRIAELLQ